MQSLLLLQGQLAPRQLGDLEAQQVDLPQARLARVRRLSSKPAAAVAGRVEGRAVLRGQRERLRPRPLVEHGKLYAGSSSRRYSCWPGERQQAAHRAAHGRQSHRGVVDVAAVAPLLPRRRVTINSPGLDVPPTRSRSSAGMSATSCLVQVEDGLDERLIAALPDQPVLGPLAHQQTRAPW